MIIDPYRFASTWSPSSLFGGGEKGGYWNVAQANVWSDNGTTQITDTGTIYRIDDLSGNGNHWLQTTAASRPAWHANSGTPYAQFDGTDDNMTIALPANITSSAVTGSFAGRYDTGAANYARLLSTGEGGFLDYANARMFQFSFVASGNAGPYHQSVAGPTVALAADTDAVIQGALDATNQYIKKDAAARSSSAHGVTPALDIPTLRLMHSESGNYALGRFTGGLIIDRLLTATEMTNLATWLGATQGRSI